MLDQNLTPAQYKAATHVEGPCLVLAGAGTGKTKVITQRIAYLILEKKVAPEKIVALTFTDKAAGEMEERLDQLLPYGMFGTTIATFHAYCHEIVSRHSYVVGVDPNARLIGSSEAISLLRNNLKRLPLKEYLPPNNPVRFLKDLLHFVDKAKEEQISPEKLIDHAEELLRNPSEEEGEDARKTLELAHCYSVVNQIFREANVLTYADLINLTLQILQKSASARKAEKDRIQYLLIDEFQDTNTAQAAIAYLITNAQENIFVVGDDDQAIYRFRGANIDNILNFRKQFPKAELITLTDNFRSSQPILNAAYALIQNNNPHRLEAIEKIDKHLRSHSEFTSPVSHLHFSHNTYEQEYVANAVARLIKEGIEAKDIALLARSHAHLDGFEQELLNRNIAVNRQKDGSFYEQPTVQQIISYIRFLVKPNDSFNLFFLLAEEPFSLPLQQLRELQVAARKVNNSLWEQLALENDQPEVMAAREYLQNQLSDKRNQKPTEAIRLHIQTSNWEKQLVEKEGIAELKLLNTFYFEARSFEQLHKPVVLSQFVTHLDDLIASGEDIRVENEMQDSSEGVQLMTIHASKGLEFATVFVVNAVMDRFPARNRGGGLPIPEELLTSEKDLVPYEEERRLAYVAFTRAKEQLFITTSKRYSGNKRDKKISPFVVEALETKLEPEFSDTPLTTSIPKQATVKKTVFALPNAFTASALEAFEDSPERYLHEYVYRLLQEESAYSSFGTTIHEVLRAYFAAKNAGETFTLDSYYLSRWSSVGYENKETEERWKEEGLTSLQKYIENHQEAEPALLEHGVELMLENGIKIIGKIDRIDKDADGVFHIIDYKTGRSEKPATPKDNLPLAIYAAALKQKGFQVGSISLHYVITGQELKFAVTDAFIEKTIERVKEIIENIKGAHETSTFPATAKFFS